MLELQYNNFLGSYWVNWEEYKLQYAKRWGSSDFIQNYPTERSHMFRYFNKETNEIFDYKEINNTLINFCI